MKRIDTACYALLASAFILAGLLLVHLDGRLTSKAHADMVVNRANFTVMTARTSANEEGLFVLDNVSEKLLVYTISGRNRFELIASEPLGAPAAGPVRRPR